jgi:hypothetical protein
MLVRIYRIGETCGHEQVTPVSIGQLYRRTQLFHASLAQLERSKTNALQSLRGFLFPRRAGCYRTRFEGAWQLHCLALKETSHALFPTLLRLVQPWLHKARTLLEGELFPRHSF